MADYADVSEIEEIEKTYSSYPSISEIADMCQFLKIGIDSFRTVRESDAWAYYHELKSMVDQHQRKTA